VLKYDGDLERAQEKLGEILTPKPGRSGSA
jgi:hypothetical protein